MNWDDILHTGCDAIILVIPSSHSISFTFKCQSTDSVLFRSLLVTGRALWTRSCLPFHPAIFPGVSLEWHLEWLSLNFAMILETLIKLWVTESDFLEKLFCPKIWIMEQKQAKNKTFKFKEKTGYYFSLNLFYNENIYYLLCSCTKLEI